MWQWSSQQVLPNLETLLHAWPSQIGLWQAWLSWARFHPARPSVVAFEHRLPTWRAKDPCAN